MKKTKGYIIRGRDAQKNKPKQQLERLGNHGTHSLAQYKDWSNAALKRVNRAGDSAQGSFKELKDMAGELSACFVNERRATARLMARCERDRADAVERLCNAGKDLQAANDRLHGGGGYALGECVTVGCSLSARVHYCMECAVSSTNVVRLPKA